MESREVYLSLGSNLGDRRSNLDTAVALLSESFGHGYKRISSVIETRSWGFSGADFLNMAVVYDTTLEPLEILHICKSVESRMGRPVRDAEYDSTGKRIYRDRIIDIDILLIGEEVISLPELTVPHPRMNERDFVLIPLRQILVKKNTNH